MLSTSNPGGSGRRIPCSSHACISRVARLRLITGGGAGQSSEPLLTGEHPFVGASPSKLRLRWWVAASVAVHLLLLASTLIGGLPVSFQRNELGVEEGIPESLTVSVITEQQLRSLSSNPITQSATPPLSQAKPEPDVKPEPETKPEPEAKPEPQVKPEQDVKPEQQAKPQSEEKAPTPAPKAEQKTASVAPKVGAVDPEAYATKAAEEFSASIARAFQQQEKKTEKKRQTVSASGAGRTARVSGAAHSGKSDEFTRAVVWALGATVPEGLGVRGSTVVTFVVSAGGRPDGLRIIRASGSHLLDQGALLAVRQARLPVPPQGRPAADRTFDIEYIAY